MPSRPGQEDNAPPAVAPVAGPQAVATPAHRWYHTMSAVLLVAFCVEIGLFLLIFPWTEYWDANYFSHLAPQWRVYWDNGYFRGAVSALGALNLYISVVEIFRLRRFGRRH
jgi:hypothetical protein